MPWKEKSLSVGRAPPAPRGEGLLFLDKDTTAQRCVSFRPAAAAAEGLQSERAGTNRKLVVWERTIDDFWVVRTYLSFLLRFATRKLYLTGSIAGSWKRRFDSGRVLSFLTGSLRLEARTPGFEAVLPPESRSRPPLHALLQLQLLARGFGGGHDGRPPAFQRAQSPPSFDDRPTLLLINITPAMTDLLSALPAELGLRIALNLPLPSLAAFEQVSRAWRALVLEHEDLVFARAAGHDYTAEGQGAAAGLEHASEVEKKRVFRTAAWEAIGSWREFCTLPVAHPTLALVELPAAKLTYPACPLCRDRPETVARQRGLARAPLLPGAQAHYGRCRRRTEHGLAAQG
jgi:hypothetical protein